MKATTVKEGLIAVKWILENVGWSQRALFRDKQGEYMPYCELKNLGSCCLWGAILLVETETIINHGMQDLVSSVIRDETGFGGIAYYNDKFSIKKQDVIDVVDEAIRRA
jgi:hypothetical protein